MANKMSQERRNELEAERAALKAKMPKSKEAVKRRNRRLQELRMMLG